MKIQRIALIVLAALIVNACQKNLKTIFNSTFKDAKASAEELSYNIDNIPEDIQQSNKEMELILKVRDSVYVCLQDIEQFKDKMGKSSSAKTKDRTGELGRIYSLFLSQVKMIIGIRNANTAFAAHLTYLQTLTSIDYSSSSETDVIKSLEITANLYEILPSFADKISSQFDAVNEKAEAYLALLTKISKMDSIDSISSGLDDSIIWDFYNEMAKLLNMYLDFEKMRTDAILQLYND